jgi:hypothetical protein
MFTFILLKNSLILFINIETKIYHNELRYVDAPYLKFKNIKNILI